MTRDVFILGAARTPIGGFGGALAGLEATRLGAAAIRGVLSKAGMAPESVEEAYIGNVISANLGQAPARQAVRIAGLGENVTSTTINKVCASGLKAAALAAQSVMLGDAEVAVAGGMESMSNVPYYIPKARYGYGFGHGELLDGLSRDGLTDAYDPIAMGVCGDQTARKYHITREQQDAFAISSYRRSAEAYEKGLFNEELIPVEIPGKRGELTVVGEDEEFRKVKFEKIPGLRPAFSPDGTVTAANASSISDGAAAVVLSSARSLSLPGIKPLARIVAYADAEQEPLWFTTTPVLATRKLLEKAGMSIDEIDYFEVNEAFSVVVLAYMQLLGVPHEKVNVNGGSVSLGHPLGASGARILTTLVHVLRQRKGRFGIAAICNGGGGATAVLIENLWT